MKSIKNLKFGFLWMLSAFLMVTSCKDEVIDSEVFEEGLPVSVEFTISTPKPNEVQSRATDVQETRVEKLALFFYRDENSLPIAYEVPELGTPTAGSTTNYFYNVTIPESAGLTSGKWYIYAVANWHKGFWDSNMKFDDFAGLTKAEMDKYAIRKSVTTIDITETAILLTGKYVNPETKNVDKVALKPGNNSLPAAIGLRRSLAKITFKFNAGEGVTFIPETYDVYNYSRSSSLMERTGWVGVNGTDPGNLEWMGKGAMADQGNFNSGTGVPITDNYIMFYMPENVQKSKSVFTDKMLREKKGSDGKFMYAPDYGTYVVVHGRYRGPGENGQGEVTAFVHYTIHLGDFSSVSRNYDNYAIRRNTKYNYNVTVNGVNSIIVEAKTDNETNPGAEGDVIHTGGDNTKLLDSHYETCIVSFRDTVIKNVNSFGIVLRTPKDILLDKVITEQELSGKDIDWIKFGKPAGTTTYAPYPGNGSKDLYNIIDLIKSFKDDTYKNKFFVSNGNVYLQAYVDEFYYNDLTLDKFVNAPNREMTLAFGSNISSDKNSSYTETPIFSIVQRSIKSAFNLSVENPFGLEIEENGQSSWATPSNPIAMPVMLSKENYDGNNNNDGKSGKDLWNGYNNTIGNITIGERWDKYINVRDNTMNKDFNYGLYQFLIRNRDENGNGIIDSGEIKWYMPSVNQHNAIWAGYHALSDEAHLNAGILYYSSTNGINRAFWATEGAFGAYKIGEEYDESGRYYVRCIRSLCKDVTALTTRISTYDPNTRVFTITGLGQNALRQSGSQVGEYLFHSQHDISNKLPQKFKMADDYLKDITIGKTPGDPYCPVVEITNTVIEEDPSSDWITAAYTYTVDITITREGTHSYWHNTTPSLEGATLISGKTAQVTVKGQFGKWSGNGKTTQTVYILADNGNYVMLTQGGSKSSPAVVKSAGVVISQNKPNPGRTTSTFTVDEIANIDLCKDYSVEPDGSDKGKWRIPNQRELTVMLLHCNKLIGDGGYDLKPGTGCRSYYDGRTTPEAGMYFVQDPGTFITSNNESEPISEFYIIPVRDVQ